MKHTCHLIISALLSVMGACTPSPDHPVKTDALPDIYPDYTDVTVPQNIAPLNFLMRDSCRAMYVTIRYGDTEVVSHHRGNEAIFNLNKWRKLMQAAAGSEVTVEVSALCGDKWTTYRPFKINVSADSIDPYLTYRLIEPDYEVYSRLQIMERCLEDFTERPICDYSLVGNRCMNCHTYAPGDNDLSFLYVRGPGGGMVLNDRGNLRMLDMRTDDMVSGSVYAQFSPSGRYIVFSANNIIPAFHTRPEKRLEVFDLKSDVYVYDLGSDRLLRSPLLADTARLETFPTFSADGRSIYLCIADGPAHPARIDSLQYSLCRVSFDESNGTIGNTLDTIISATTGANTSVSHPRVSPDGRHLLYTVSDYGTFPIWHREADLRMIDLTTGKIDQLSHVNSDMSDTYHSWSESGRWFVFASKRDDGLYGKPYFAYVDSDGKVSKPFVLPQKNPTYYDNTLKSFNVPELGTRQVSFTSEDIIPLLPK